MLTLYLSTLRRANRNVRLYLLSVALLGFTTSGGIQPVLLNLYLLRLGHGLSSAYSTLPVVWVLPCSACWPASCAATGATAAC